MNKKVLNHLVLYLISIGLSYSCGNSGDKSGDRDRSQQSIMVFAAASLSDVLSEITVAFEAKYDVKVKINLASSGKLARQIEQGGIPDVYISANQKWMDYIAEKGYLVDGYKSEIANNDLVLVAPINSELTELTMDNTLKWDTILGNERLSIGDPAHVPAGIYAKQSLEHFGWYDLLKLNMLPAKDVRSALMVVEMEETPVGIVYRTDAQKSSKVKILGVFPEKSHDAIVYVAGVCNNNLMAKDFFKFLNSETTKPIWRKYGFRK